MKKNLLPLLSLLLSFSFMSQTCRNNAALSLMEGQSKNISLKEQRFQVTCISINESRCPMNARCIRAGEAIATLVLKNKTGAGQEITLCEGVDCKNDQKAVISYGTKSYQINLISITPDPAKTLKKDIKKVTFTIQTIT